MAPVNFWGTATATVASDTQAAEQGINLGTVFKANVVGNITHLRCYETPVMAGTVTLRLYDSSAAVLASATFTAVNGDSGWREVALATPYTTTAGAWYMVAYHSPVRNTLNNIYSTVTPNLSAARSTSGGELTTAVDGAQSFGGNTGNGRYQYGALAMPANTFQSENYGADVVFEADLSAPGPVSRVAVTTGAPAAATAFQPTLPTHAAGDRLSLIVTGKYNTTTVPTINQGWTLVKSGTGGTGATGNDTGQVFWAVYQKDATSSAETAPTVTPGATAPNSWEWIAVTHRPGANTVWRDAITTDTLQVQGGSDTSTASPLTATSSGFGSDTPGAGDALFAVGVIPTDLGSALGTTTLTMTGLSGGTKSTATTQYVENALGQDTAAVWAGWTDLTGTGTVGSGLAVSFTVTGATNQSGAIIALAFRTQSAVVNVNGSASRTGTGAIAATGEMAASRSASIAGTAAVAAVAAIGTLTGAALAGTGSIGASGVVGEAVVAYEGTSSIAGTGSRTASGVVGAAASASRTGAGSITASGTVARASSASRTGTGTLSASGSVGRSAGSSLVGAADIATTASVGTSEGAALAGEGQIVADGVLSRLTGASVAGSGTIGASGVVAKATGASVSGTGSITAGGEVEVLALYGSASIVGTGTIGTGPSIGLRAAAQALVGIGSIEASGSSVSGLIAVADVDGIGVLSAAGRVAASLGASRTGTGTITATGALGVSRTSTLTGTGSITAGGVTARYGSAARTGAGLITATGTTSKSGTASLSGVAAIAAGGSVSESGEGASTLAGTGTVSAAGQVARSAAGVLSGAGDVSASGAVGTERAASLSGEGSITVGHSSAGSADVALVATAVIAASGVLGTPGESVANPQVLVTPQTKGATSIRPYAGSVRVVPNTGTVSLED